MKTADYTAANRAAWNAAAEQHRGERWDTVVAQLTDPAQSPFEPEALALLNDIGVAGKDAIQLCCNNGREVLSLKKLGAGRCVGVDISDKFIEQARELAVISGLDGEFVRADVIDLPESLGGAFDLVLFTVGALNWLPDMDGLFASAAGLLRPGGHLLIHEMHPILWMFEPDRGTELLYSYFQQGAFEEDNPLNYYGGADYEAPTNYGFQATLGDIFTGILSAGLTIRHFKEYPIDICCNFPHFAGQDAQLPLSYTLLAEKVPNPAPES